MDIAIGHAIGMEGALQPLISGKLVFFHTIGVANCQYNQNKQCTSSPSKFITELINSLSVLQPSAANPQDTTSNPLNFASEAAKKQLLTLHVLFPNELLPALDLLDRRLVTRFRAMPNSSLWFLAGFSAQKENERMRRLLCEFPEAETARNL